MDLLELFLDRIWDTLADFVLWLQGDVEGTPQKIVLWGGVLVLIVTWLTIWFYLHSVDEAKGYGAYDAYREVANKGVVVRVGGPTLMIVIVLTMVTTILFMLIVLSPH